ncbi:MAG: divalent metal cation transporter [Candidatus Methylopumilus sp.]|nr:divalent metal cation transporter [Candidatus Methylopumilus sp.]
MRYLKLPKILKKLGPGLITGAADDDPSGIATYSQAGAHHGFGVLWTMFFTYPLMVGIQMVSARIGLVTGRGLAENMRRFYPKYVTWPLVILLLIANTINIAADLAAMADAVKLVIGGPRHLYAVAFGMCCLLLQIFIPYERYVRVLKWLTLSLFAYVGTVFASNVEWNTVIKATIFPNAIFTNQYALLIVGIFGTTISPYLFFWQAGQEVEEVRIKHNTTYLKHNPQHLGGHLRRIRIDTMIGMGFSNLIAFFIMLTTAATLFKAGIHDIETSAQAAEALRPIAGEFTFILFAAGIIGTGLLAVPVLAGSAAYAVAELLKKPASLNLSFHAAKDFYAVIAIATLLGVVLDFSGIDPIKALLWSAVINGIVAVPLMIALMNMASRPKVMRSFTIGKHVKHLGWMATLVMGIAVATLAWMTFLKIN